MNKTDLVQIEEVVGKKLKEELKPIKLTLDEHTLKLDEHTRKLDEHTLKLDEHTERLDSLTLDMINVQKKTDLLPDIFDYVKGTKEKVDDLEKRVETLEAAA
ncbi:hypothetical protein HY469_04120 [Candidatus Roizmanbacteria bacterium]|nr:hypothetical protein [Candidatus Roizmanbacteria bacterium]